MLFHLKLVRSCYDECFHFVSAWNEASSDTDSSECAFSAFTWKVIIAVPRYYPSQTSVDKDFFSARFRDRWFLPAVQKFWSRDNIFAALRLAKHETRDVILVVPVVAKSGLPVSCFSRLCLSPEEGKMPFVQFKVFYGDNSERCKMHRMKKERFELITYQELLFRDQSDAK